MINQSINQSIKNNLAKSAPPRHLNIQHVCHYREMYYYFMPLLFSCYNFPLLLLLISPSVFALSDLCLQNTPLAYFILYFTLTRSKTIFKHVPQLLLSYWFFNPFPLFIFVFRNTSPAHKVFYFIPPCNYVVGEAHPLLLFTFIPTNS